MIRTHQAPCWPPTAIALAAPCTRRRQELNFGIISTESAGALKQMWEPFLDDMSKKTGLKVKAFFAHRLRRHHRGACASTRCRSPGIGNKSAMEAVDRASGEVFAQVVDARRHARATTRC